MSSIIILQLAAVALTLAVLFSVRSSLRAAEAPSPAALRAPEPVWTPAGAGPIGSSHPVAAPAPEPSGPTPEAMPGDKLRLVAPSPVPPARGEDDLSAEQEIALLERERDAALQQSAAAWKLLFQTRAERDRLREELEEARAALAAAEAKGRQDAKRGTEATARRVVRRRTMANDEVSPETKTAS